VRAVEADGEELRVVVTPTYSGCPATEVIGNPQHEQTRLLIAAVPSIGALT